MQNTTTRFSFAIMASLLMLVLGLLYGATSASAQVASTTATSTSSTATSTSSNPTATSTGSTTATTTGSVTITPIPIIISAPVTTSSISLGALIPLCEIQRTLRTGSSGEDVRCLQKFLNFAGYTVATTGAGSPGSESAYFGPATANAVRRWQNANATFVLSPAGLSSGTGTFGPLSFNYYAALVRTALGVSAL